MFRGGKKIKTEKTNLKKQYIGIILMLLCAVCLCFGQLVWKLMEFYPKEYSWIFIIGGFGIFLIGFSSMILALRKGELSVLQPINSISYVLAAFTARFMLPVPEEITALKIAGIILIVGGVIIIGRSSK